MNVSVEQAWYLPGNGEVEFGKLWNGALGDVGEIVVLMDDSREW